MLRSMKSLHSTRPIWHERDETIRGSVFCTYPTFALRTALEDRLEAADVDEEWAEVHIDLDRLAPVGVEKDAERVLVLSTTAGGCGDVLEATGVAIPSTVTHPARGRVA